VDEFSRREFMTCGSAAALSILFGAQNSRASGQGPHVEFPTDPLARLADQAPGLLIGDVTECTLSAQCLPTP
jgi:hypothetical protein